MENLSIVKHFNCHSLISFISSRHSTIVSVNSRSVSPLHSFKLKINWFSIWSASNAFVSPSFKNHCICLGLAWSATTLLSPHFDSIRKVQKRLICTCERENVSDLISRQRLLILTCFVSHIFLFFWNLFEDFFRFMLLPVRVGDCS